MITHNERLDDVGSGEAATLRAALDPGHARMGQRLTALMKIKGLTPTSLVKAMGYTAADEVRAAASRIRQIMDGKTADPGAYFLYWVARHLEVSLAYLVTGIDPDMRTVAGLREDMVDRMTQWLAALATIEMQAHVAPPHQLRAVAETRASYAFRQVPVIDGEQGRRLLDRLRRQGKLGEVAAGAPMLAILIEIPQEAREEPEIDDLYKTEGYMEFGE